MVMSEDGETLHLKKKIQETRVLKLKLEIKAWEKQFIHDHGRQPKKDDVKADPLMERRYREYRKYKDRELQTSGGSSRPTDASHNHNRASETTKGRNARDSSVEPTTPQKPRPAVIKEVGPTPQMDGRVLGIFDLVPSSIIETPVKTVVSSTTVTPVKNVPASVPYPALETPLSHNGTPAYLSTGQGSALYTGDSPLLQRKVSRSLASMLEDLKHIQEERLGEEFENFRPQDTPASGDDFSETEKQPDEQPGSKVYKKKGQKRQTRRVKMKPTSGPVEGLGVSKSKKPQENFQKLKLKNSGYKTNKSKFFFGRRSR